MWMSVDKRRTLAKETSRLPYLSGASREEEDLATRTRSDIIEYLFDHFIRPDVPSSDPSAPGRLTRAKQLWSQVLAEKRASYFIALKDSKYVEWIVRGAAIDLPCTTDEIKRHNTSLPELTGDKIVTERATEVRATLLKCADRLEQRLLEMGVQAEKRLALKQVRDILKKVTDPQWFIKRQPKVFTKYEALLASWLERREP